MQESGTVRGAFDSIKEALSVDKLREYFHTYKDHVWDIGLFFCIGMLGGFFLKKYVHYIFAALIPIILLGFFHYINLATISFDIDRINKLLGMHLPPLDSTLFPLVSQWIKSNVSLAVSFVIGCLVGSKIA